MGIITDHIVAIGVAFLVSMVFAFLFTPPVRLLAKKIGAVDVPKDNRRMHKTPIPRMGGLAIFLGFLTSVLLFVRIDGQLRGILFGAVVLIILGIFDDVMALNPWIKLFFQAVAAIVPIANGVIVERMTNFAFWSNDLYVSFGIFSIPLTLIWIVGMTNAFNWIDGLDGLCVGISSIAALTTFIISMYVGDGMVAIIAIALTGACLGFMPYNRNPAKIFMGDTGAMFLGYMLATLSVQGMFKLYAVVSFAVPLLVMIVPLFDSVFSIIRRLLKGKSPFYADRGHIHHRLIDLGLSQKQAVAILYIASGLMGLAAVVLTTSGEMKALVLLVAAVIAAVIGIMIYMNTLRQHAEKQAAQSAEAHAETPPQEGNRRDAGEGNDEKQENRE